MADVAQAVGDVNAKPANWPRLRPDAPKAPVTFEVTEAPPPTSKKTPRVLIKDIEPADPYAGLPAQTVAEMKAGAAALKR